MSKKIALFCIFTAVLAVFFSYGCRLTSVTQEWGPTKTNTPYYSPTMTPTITMTGTNTPYYSPTITPTIVFGVYVQEAYVGEQSGSSNMTQYLVILKNDTASGAALTGAVVSIGGVMIPETAAGTYSLNDFSANVFASDASVSLNITSSRGNVSATGVMAKKVLLTNPADFGSSVSIASPYTVQWTYPDGAPAGQSHLSVYSIVHNYVNEFLPGATVSRVISAGTMFNGESVTVSIETDTFAAITDATIGSADFNCQFYRILSFGTVP